MINVDFRDRRPIYEQLVESIKDQIMRGILTEDEQLPSVRALAAELGINPNTIQKAYSELERQGITYTVLGKGCFVSIIGSSILEAKKSEILKKLHIAAKEAKDLGIDMAELETAIHKGYCGGDIKND
ncbi:MAG: GntR family transcriptional regulator [Ruminococcaceae bacterium]|nr:GntR family transcriptional regulator [Oscillospiraceae bacterium]